MGTQVNPNGCITLEIKYQPYPYNSDEVSMADGLGHAVGLDRIEQLAHEYGDDDPFEMKPIKRAKGTFEEPTVISSQFEKRLVGCVCEEDALTIQWLTVYKGEPKRCKCGYWFKLIDAQ